MQEPSKAVSSGTGAPPVAPGRNWINILVPFLPILLALVAAMIAARYQGPRSDINHGLTLVGSPAPAISLPDAHGQDTPVVATGKPSLIVFYLGYSCPLCVRHLRELADQQDKWRAAGAQVVAVSLDSVKTSRKAIEKYGDFPFPLLSDSEARAARLYGVKPSEGFHGIFIVDRNGKVRFEHRSDRPYDNIAGLIKRLEELHAEK